ncbi:MAG: nitrous oxide reductase family maturation protein NosD [Phycisphaerales bacterium]
MPAVPSIRPARGLLVALAAAGVAAASAARAAEAPGAAAVRPMSVVQELVRAAPEGATVEVPAGTYRGELVIDRRVTLVGVGRPVFDGGGNGDIVTIRAAGAQLRGFVVRGTGTDLDKENCAVRVHAPGVVIEDNDLDDVLFGIDLHEAPDSVIRRNRIGGKPLDIARRGDGLRLWRADRTIVEENSIHDGRDAIIWYSTGVRVLRNRSFRCRYGFHLMYSNEVEVRENELTENSVGVYLMYSARLRIEGNRIVRNRGPSGYGIGLKETDDFHIEENLLLGNCVGIYVDGSPFVTPDSGIVRRNTIAANDVGLALLPAVRGNQVWDNSFVDNVEQVAVQGRGTLRGNAFEREERGNFWSDYAGYDADADGVGEADYDARRLFENLVDRQPGLRIFLFSPAQQAIEFVARAIPAVRPEVKFTDQYPLTEPPVMHRDAAAGGGSAGLAALAATLGVAAGAVLVAGRMEGGRA